MAQKSAVPLILGLGAAALIFMPKKKKKSPTNGGGEDSLDPGPLPDENAEQVVNSGTQGGWSWRVRHVPVTINGETFDGYWGEARKGSAFSWQKAHPTPAKSEPAARGYALEYIIDQP